MTELTEFTKLTEFFLNWLATEPSLKSIILSRAEPEVWLDEKACCSPSPSAALRLLRVTFFYRRQVAE
jgi:hypothetical protein